MEYIKKRNWKIKTPEQKEKVFKWLELSLNDYQDRVKKE